MIQEKQIDLRGKYVLLYDGVCALCNGLNKFVLLRDKKDVFRFASLQSQFAHDVLNRHQQNASDLDTFYLLANYGLPSETIRQRADAVLFVLAQIGGLYSLSKLLRLLPRFLLDWLYNMVATNRYKLFGKYETCLLPSAEYADKFIAL